MKCRPSFGRLAGALAVLALGAPSALAGGLQRPNMVGTRSVGFGGAFAAIADDPTALFHNPAGLSQVEHLQVLLAGDLIYAPRSHVPVAEDGTEGPRQSSADNLTPLPAGAVARRFAIGGAPTRLVFGVGAWLTYGGSLNFPKDEAAPVSGVVDSSTTALVEVSPGLGYAVNDVLSIGVALRVGIGLFDLTATEKPIDSEISSSGVGIGATLGVLVRPSAKLALSAVYRSALDVTTKGDGALTVPGPGGGVRNSVDVKSLQEWPSFMSLGLAYQLSPVLMLAAQLDRSQWSDLADFVVEVPAQPLLNQEFDLSWSDSYAAHLGAGYALSPTLSLRGGITYDTSAFPDRTVERQYLDNDTWLLGAGASVALAARWTLEASTEVMIGRPREIENNSAAARDAGWSSRANLSPGTYEGSLWSALFALRYGR